jgi:hypothetical protein
MTRWGTNPSKKNFLKNYLTNFLTDTSPSRKNPTTFLPVSGYESSHRNSCPKIFSKFITTLLW